MAYIFKILNLCKLLLMLTRRNYFQYGFIATTAVLMLALSSLVFITVTALSVTEYSESVYTREQRIQKGLFDRACSDTKILLLRKDSALKGNVDLPEFNCTITIP